MERRYIRVSGYVQGVGFRYYVKYTASGLGLTGWVRNRDDGDVELEAQGSAEEMESFLDALWRGNRYSSVQDLQIRRLEPEAEYHFEIVG